VKDTGGEGKRGPEAGVVETRGLERLGFAAPCRTS
jgi:hypothetical protein